MFNYWYMYKQLSLINTKYYDYSVFIDSLVC